MLNPIICDLTQEFAKKNYTLISDNLQNAINSAFIKKEKVILFLNRLGYARRIACQDCGLVVKCLNCLAPLSSTDKKSKELICFKCNLSHKIETCRQCRGVNFKFTGFTIGKITNNLKKLYPTVNIAQTGLFEPASLLKNNIILFSSTHRCDLGRFRLNSQINTAAILNADTFLNLPDYTAGEKTYALLQKIYKLARDLKAQKFLVQTFEPQNYILKSFLTKNDSLFYQTELANRQKLLYPPFSRLIKLIYQNKNQDTAKKQTYNLFDKIKKILLNTKNEQIMPPIPCFPAKTGNNFRWQMTIKAKSEISSRLKELLFSLEPAWLIETE